MQPVVSTIYGILGIILGFTVPTFSYKIITYKKGEKYSKSGFLYTNIFKVILSIINGLAWILASLNAINNFIGLLFGALITIGLLIIFIDLQIRIIPNELVLAMAIVGILFQTFKYGLASLATSVVCMAVMMAVFTSVAGFVGFGKVGAGDVKLAGVMGLSLGYLNIVMAVMFMAIILLIFIIIGLLFKKIYLSTMLPMAPFMMTGYIVSLLLEIL